MRIPTGVSALVQRFGADVGEWSPGLHFAPIWYKVVYLVTKQSCTYYYEVANVPTKDNVMVKVEVNLVFRVNKPASFVYTLGATKFDDSLKAVAEEAIRANVRQIKHHHIYEIRGSGAEYLLKTLNEKFNNFGVSFTNVTIPNVELPKDLASALQNATTFDAKMKNQIRSQEFQLKLLNDENDQLLKKLFLENERESAAETARKERVLIELDTKQVAQEKEKQYAIIKAQQDASIMKTKAVAALESESLNAKAEVELMVKRTEGEAQSKRIEVEQSAQTERIQSEAGLTEATNRAKAIALEADAEQKVFEQLKQKREFDLQLASIKALQSLAQKGKIVISGQNGKTLIDSITGSVPLLTGMSKKDR
jgi:regulator of protease activity HflC (stomatin/prohibitin superfamily)